MSQPYFIDEVPRIRSRRRMLKAVAVFVIMFAVSFCLTRIELVDYGEHIENKRRQIVRLSDLGDFDDTQTVYGRIATICERSCRKEWKILKDEMEDLAILVAAVCSLLFWMGMVERIVVHKRSPYIRLEGRRPRAVRISEGIVCGGMLVVFGLAYVFVATVMHWLSALLMRPKGPMTVASESSVQFLSALDQLLVCSKWINIAYYVLGEVAVLTITVWCFSNVHLTKR